MFYSEEEAEDGAKSEKEDKEASAATVKKEGSPEKPPEPPTPELPVYLPAIQGCRSVEEFHCLNRIEEGTYGVVYRARDKRTGTPIYFLLPSP